MSLYKSLDQYVGAALLACAPAVGCEVPSGAIAEGGRTGGKLSAHLRERGEAGQVGAVLDALAQDVWLAQDTRGIPHQVSEEHAVALAGVLARFPPLVQDVVAAIEKARSGLGGHAEGTVPAYRRIAADVFKRARDGGGLAGREQVGHALSEDVTLFLLDRLFCHLLDDPGLLPSVAKPMREFLALATAPTAPPVPAPAASSLPGRPSAPATDGKPQTLPLEPAHLVPFEARGEVALLAEIRDRYGLSNKALGRCLAMLGAEHVEPEQMLSRLEDLAAWLRSMREQLLRPTNDDAEARRLKGRIAAVLGDGDFEAAADLMKQVRRRLRDNRRHIEERLQEEIAGLKVQMAEEALATGRLAELAMARFDFDSAADYFAEAAETAPRNDRASQWRYLMRQAEALARKGEERSEPAALTRALQVYETALRLAAEARNTAGEAAAQAGLANALAKLGERELGVARLREAIAAFRKALVDFPRAEEPRRWAVSQMQLGHALAVTAERTGQPASQREAATAFREALTELTRERTPMDWAMAQIGLGNALLALDESETERRGDLLEEAVGAFRAALKVLARERNALDWAALQTSLGSALLGLGEREGLSGRVEEAVAACREALKVYTRAAHPSQWSLAMMSLGNALASLGDRDHAATSRFEEAVSAYEASLAELSRDKTPMPWAITQMNLGTVLIRLGERRDKRRHWLAAAGAMVPALEVFERAGASDYAELTRRNLRRFHEQWESLLAPPPAIDAA